MFHYLLQEDDALFNCTFDMVHILLGLLLFTNNCEFLIDSYQINMQLKFAVMIHWDGQSDNRKSCTLRSIPK